MKDSRSNNVSEIKKKKNMANYLKKKKKKITTLPRYVGTSSMSIFHTNGPHHVRCQA